MTVKIELVWLNL